MHGSIKQKQDFTGSEFGQTLQDGLQGQFAHFGELEASGLPGQIPDHSIIGQQQWAPEDTAFHGDLDIVAIHHEVLTLPVRPQAPFRTSGEELPLTENPALQKLPLQSVQLIAVSHQFQAGLSRVAAIL